MYLHNDRKLFERIIDQTNKKTKIAKPIIEKDYYVTMILKCLAQSSLEPGSLRPVFKGGTSLSKCFHLIDRFSEDIDITFVERLGESRRKKLKYKIVGPIGDELSMRIQNWDDIESDKNCNCYKFGYQSVLPSAIPGISSVIQLETALISQAFPTEKNEISNFIYDAMKDDVPEIAVYGLGPFPMRVQSVRRTFIDKIFALCDYYLKNETKRFSRHLYDICKLYPVIAVDDEFTKLIKQVREHRKQLPTCPAAQDNVDIKKLIAEFLDSDFYRQDYEETTRTLISDGITYEQTVAVLREIADRLF